MYSVADIGVCSDRGLKSYPCCVIFCVAGICFVMPGENTEIGCVLRGCLFMFQMAMPTENVIVAVRIRSGERENAIDEWIAQGGVIYVTRPVHIRDVFAFDYVLPG